MRNVRTIEVLIDRYVSPLCVCQQASWSTTTSDMAGGGAAFFGAVPRHRTARPLRLLPRHSNSQGPATGSQEQSATTRAAIPLTDDELAPDAPPSKPLARLLTPPRPLLAPPHKEIGNVTDGYLLPIVVRQVTQRDIR